jgi:hypothetical protein
MTHSTEADPSRQRISDSKAELSERPSDPKLRAQTERILAMAIDDRLRQIEEEANFFLSARPLDG